MLNRKNIALLIIITSILTILLGLVSYLIYRDLFIAMFALVAGLVNVFGYLIFFFIYRDGVSMGRAAAQIILKYGILLIFIGGCILIINNSDMDVEYKDACSISLMIGLASSIITPFIFVAIIGKNEKKDNKIIVNKNVETLEIDEEV